MYSQTHFDGQPLSSTSQPQVAAWMQYRPQSSYLLSQSIPPPQGWVGIQTGADLVGRPIYFRSGTCMGRTIRMELHEIQKADVGRKYARVDRRPLDPPPVVLLKTFEVHNVGTEEEHETEIEYDDVQGLGLLCTVDLFPVPDHVHAKLERTGRMPSAYMPENAQVAALSPSLSPSSSTYMDPHNLIQKPDHFYNPSFSGSSSHDTISRGVPDSYTLLDIVHDLDGYPITEQSKQTNALVGETFVQSVKIEYLGRKALVFVFSDLAVRLEGHFILRYRCFDIFAQPYSDSDDSAISAACYGRPFRVYSTKQFPGLSRSTELTKRLAMWGARLTTRATDRRLGKKLTPKKGRRSLSI